MRRDSSSASQNEKLLMLVSFYGLSLLSACGLKQDFGSQPGLKGQASAESTGS